MSKNTNASESWILPFPRLESLFSLDVSTTSSAAIFNNNRDRAICLNCRGIPLVLSAGENNRRATRCIPCTENKRLSFLASRKSEQRHICRSRSISQRFGNETLSRPSSCFKTCLKRVADSFIIKIREIKLLFKLFQ